VDERARLTVRILHLEGSALDAELVCSYLKRFGLDHWAEPVDSEMAFMAAVAQARNFIDADYQPLFFGGIHRLSIAHERVPHSPFISMSGTLGEERAMESLKGAWLIRC
jgi:hypothetical protein